MIPPKVSDVAASIQHLMEVSAEFDSVSLELFSVVFKDAFHICPLCDNERQVVVDKESYGKYHVSRVVLFGPAPGSLLWAKLASAAMRLAQASVHEWEASVSAL